MIIDNGTEIAAATNTDEFMSAGTMFFRTWDELDGETWFEGGLEEGEEGGTKALV